MKINGIIGCLLFCLLAVISRAESDISLQEKKEKLANIDWSGLGIESVSQQIDSVMKLYRWSIEVGDKFSEAMSLEKLGWIKGRQREYDESVYNFNKAASIFDSLGMKVDQAIQQVGIANVLYSKKKWKEAETKLRSVIPVLLDSGSYDELAFAYLTLADNFIALKQLDSCLLYIGKANLLLPKYEDNQSSNELIGIEVEAYVYYLKGDFERAIELFQVMYQRSIEEEFTYGIFTSLFYIARIQETMGEYEKAIGQLELASSLLSDQNNHMRDISFEMSDLYEKLGAKDSAIFYLHQYFAYDDSLQNSINDGLYHEMMVKHEVAELESQGVLNDMKINVLHLINEKERLFKTWIVIICLVVFLLLAITVWIIRKSINRKKQLIQVHEEMAIAKETLLKGEIELKGIKEAQLNNEIRLKNKELTNFALEVVRKNDLSRSTLKKLKQTLKEEDKKAVLKELVFFLQYNLEINKSFEELQDNLSKTNKIFVENLKSAYPKCTKNDTHVAGLIRLGLNTREIADAKNITVASVEIARHRLRKKLELSKEVNLAEFLNAI